MLLLISQNTFAQEKLSDKIEYKSDNTIHNSKNKTIILKGNVEIKSKNFTLQNADEAVVDEQKNTVTIYNPKDFKLISAKTLSKKGDSNKNIIVYNSKEESISFE